MVPLVGAALVNSQQLSQAVQVAFSQRRKLLRHTLAPWLEQNGYTGNFDVQRRAEEISVAEYVALVQALPLAPAGG
jgi:16S rRNA (adenine1518-N6/adenine1519-N6)-dimethyltransferase